MVDDYERAIARAAALPAPDAAVLPPALRLSFWQDVARGAGDFAPGVVVE